MRLGKYNVLVLGGAGYIGSHMVFSLIESGSSCVVVDNLSTGYKESVPCQVPFYNIDFGDYDDLNLVFKQHDFDAVMHFAAHSQVGESVVDPAKYYQNNFAKTQVLLDVMRENGVDKIVFSSTAAVYGEPVQDIIDEDHPVKPISPYGHSKMAVEWMLKDYASAYDLKAVALRYFNASGALPSGLNGERHDPETHLIPLVLQAVSRRRESIHIFGVDYPTKDGTCVRDYIHIMDLAEAHTLALMWLEKQPSSTYGVFNLGNGTGYSVNDIVQAAISVTGKKLIVQQAERRIGDPAVLVASSEKAKQELGWCPKITDLEDIVSHAWQWELAHGQIWGN